jgi:hypothetical protein
MKKALLAGIAVLPLMTGAAYASSHPRVETGKPKIIVRHLTIRTAIQPPPKYDVPYTGELEIVFFSHSDDLKKACSGSSDYACARPFSDLKKCIIFTLTEDGLKRKGNTYNFSMRHELAHCNGWKHSPTLGGRHFSLGEKWDEAEGGKWIVADTKMSAPKLPENTRILPAPSTVVCVTPDWKQESCAKREEGAWSYSHRVPAITANPVCPLPGQVFEVAKIPPGCFTR